MKASYLFKKNIETLLSRRGHTRHDLAFYCRRSDAWLSKILGNSDRNLPLKYLDRIADFFGLAPYQLFQPGISPLTERRNGHDRRSGLDRRISARNRTVPMSPIRQIDISPEDEALLAEIKSLTYEEAQRLRHWVSVVKLGRPGARERAAPVGQPQAVASPAAQVSRSHIARKKK